MQYHYLPIQIYKFRLGILFLFVGLSTSCCLAQQSEIDSLETIISSEVPDTVRLDAMIELASSYMATDFQQSIEVSLQVVKLSQRLNDLKREAKGYIALGIAYGEEHYSKDQTIETFDKALKIVNKIEDSILKTKILLNKAIVYQKMGLDDKAIDIYTKALKIVGENGAKLQRIGILNNIAVILQERSENDRALIYYKKALKIVEELDHERYMAILNNNIGNVYKAVNKGDSALIFFEKSLTINRKIEEKYNEALILGNIGNIYVQKKEYQLGWDYISKAYSLSKELDYAYGQSFCLSLLAGYFSALEDYEQVVKYSTQGLKTIEAVNNIKTKTKFYEFLTQAYSHLGNYQAGLEAQKNYHVLKDSVYNMDRESHINNLLIKYETKQKDSENELLVVTVAKQKNQQYFLVALLLASVGLLLAFISFIKIRQVKKIEQMRMGIAQDLHDEVGSKLTLIQIYLNKMLGLSVGTKGKEMVESGDEIYGVIKQTHFAISDLVWAISPTTNTMKDLISRLNDYADDLLVPAGIPYEFNCGSFKLDKKLDPILRQNIVLLFKETLHKILKHTNASTVKIKLFNIDNCFNLEVINEFECMKTESFSGGTGLQNMQQRAEKIGGRVLIDQKENQFKIHLITDAFA